MINTKQYINCFNPHYVFDWRFFIFLLYPSRQFFCKFACFFKLIFSFGFNNDDSTGDCCSFLRFHDFVSYFSSDFGTTDCIWVWLRFLDIKTIKGKYAGAMSKLIVNNSVKFTNISNANAFDLAHLQFSIFGCCLSPPFKMHGLSIVYSRIVTFVNVIVATIHWHHFVRCHFREIGLTTYKFEGIQNVLSIWFIRFIILPRSIHPSFNCILLSFRRLVGWYFNQ